VEGWVGGEKGRRREEEKKGQKTRDGTYNTNGRARKRAERRKGVGTGEKRTEEKGEFWIKTELGKKALRPFR